MGENVFTGSVIINEKQKMALPPLNIMEQSKSLTMIYIGSSTQPPQTLIDTGDNGWFLRYPLPLSTGMCGISFPSLFLNQLSHSRASAPL